MPTTLKLIIGLALIGTAVWCAITERRDTLAQKPKRNFLIAMAVYAAFGALGVYMAAPVIKEIYLQIP